MLDPEVQSKLEQSQAFLIEYLPTTWRRLFERLKAEGFNDDESLELVKTYIISAGSNGTKV